MKHHWLYSFLFLALPAFNLLAEEVRYYDIEVVIFESTSPLARASEIWDTSNQLETPSLFVELGQPYPGPIPDMYNPKLTFKQLPVSTYQLSEHVRSLKGSDNYNILLHLAWRQPGMDNDIALPVHVHQEYIVKTQAPAVTTHPDMPAISIPQSTAYQQSRSVLDGYIRIVLSRYLHANVDLTYTTGISQQANTIEFQGDTGVAERENPAPVFYRLQQSRKMRSKEVHYLDHPVLGMLILATPYSPDTMTPATKRR